MTAVATTSEAETPSSSSKMAGGAPPAAQTLQTLMSAQTKPDLLKVARSHVPRSSSPAATMAAYRAYRDSVRPPVLSTYTIMGFLSSGTYGRVYKARLKNLTSVQQSTQQPGAAPGGNEDEASGSVFAIKKFKPDKEEHPSYSGISQSAMREIALNRELCHENIVTLREVILEDKSIYMVFSYASHDLLQIIHHHSTIVRQPIPLPMLKSILYQLLNGVHYLHSNFVLHRDLKPANILLTSSGVVKIADLGLARVFEAPLQSLYSGDKVVVTIWYRAPELLLGARHYTTKIDIWAVGCIWGELIALRPMFKGEEAKMDPKNKQTPFQTDQFRKIVEVLGTPTKDVWPGIETMPEYKTWWPHLQQRLEGFSDGLLNWFSTRTRPPSQGFPLFHDLLQYDPLRRSSAVQALKDPFFNEVEPLPTKNVFASLANTREGETVYPARRLIKDDTDPKMVSTVPQQPQPLPAAYQQQQQQQQHSHQPQHQQQQQQAQSSGSSLRPPPTTNIFGPASAGGGAGKLVPGAPGSSMLLSSAAAAGLVGGGPSAPPPAPGSVGSAGPSSVTSTTGEGAGGPSSFHPGSSSLVGPASASSSTPSNALAANTAAGGNGTGANGGSGAGGNATARGGLVGTATANANRAAKRQKLQQQQQQQ